MHAPTGLPSFSSVLSSLGLWCQWFGLVFSQMGLLVITQTRHPVCFPSGHVLLHRLVLQASSATTHPTTPERAWEASRDTRRGIRAVAATDLGNRRVRRQTPRATPAFTRQSAAPALRMCLHFPPYTQLSKTPPSPLAHYPAHTTVQNRLARHRQLGERACLFVR